MDRKNSLRQQILALTKDYYYEIQGYTKSFEPGQSFVNYGRRYFNDKELVA